MTRNYLFRGKQINTGKWVFGFYYKTLGKHIILGSVDPDGVMQRKYEVNPETVGQFMEVTDKEDKKIFEDDVLFIPAGTSIFKKDVVGYVVFQNCCAWVIGLSTAFSIGLCSLNPKSINVIGDIYDDMEKLGVGALK